MKFFKSKEKPAAEPVLDGTRPQVSEGLEPGETDNVTDNADVFVPINEPVMTSLLDVQKCRINGNEVKVILLSSDTEMTFTYRGDQAEALYSELSGKRTIEAILRLA